MLCYPNCKINLGLNIVRKRMDGFHDLETVFYPVPLCDALEIIPAVDGVFDFQMSGVDIPGEPAKNLCVQAYKLMKAGFGLPEVKIHLHKVIPAGSGLGGGSSDAAFTIMLLNDLFDLKLPDPELAGFARKLGSDCAFFIANKPCFASGRGDQFQNIALDLSGWHLVIMIPEVQMSTALAYSLIRPGKPAMDLRDVIELPVKEWKGAMVNDFEPVVENRLPVIRKLLDHLYLSGASYAALSGSGSAVFGLFRDPPTVSESAAHFVRTCRL